MPSKAAIPPWQLWSTDPMGNKDLAAAETVMTEGGLEKAVTLYRLAAERSESIQVRAEAELRTAGTFLKLGKSKEALEEISRYVKSIGTRPEQLDYRFAVVVAFSYLHQKDLDQTLAWLSMAYAKSQPRNSTSERIAALTKQIIASVPGKSFDIFGQKWASDTFIGPIFETERLKRAQGAGPGKGIEAKWFDPRYYTTGPEFFAEEGEISPVEGGAEEESALSEAAEGVTTIGILLPLTGQFAAHAQQIKNGVELALAVTKDLDPARVRLVFGDSKGAPDQGKIEFRKLVQEGKAQVVLGPLLVKTAEEVVNEAQELGVPYITFSKKEGLTRLGREVFRLGATASSQIRKLFQYAASEEGLNNLAVVYPENPTGREFEEIAVKAVEPLGIRITESLPYSTSDESSIVRAVDRLAANQPQAIFVPDTLENALPILQRINGMNLNNIMLLGPALWDDPVAVRGFGQLVEGAVYVTPFYVNSERTVVREFVAQYKDKFGRTPDLLSAQAFDAMTFALKAIVRSDSERRTTIELLESMPPFEGVTGRIVAGERGEIERDFPVLRVTNGEAREVFATGER